MIGCSCKSCTGDHWWNLAVSVATRPRSSRHSNRFKVLAGWSTTDRESMLEADGGRGGEFTDGGD